MSTIEYRVIYLRDGRETYRDGFRKKDINLGSYFHDIHNYEVVRWEERTIGDWRPSNDTDIPR